MGGCDGTKQAEATKLRLLVLPCSPPAPDAQMVGTPALVGEEGQRSPLRIEGQGREQLREGSVGKGKEPKPGGLVPWDQVYSGTSPGQLTRTPPEARWRVGTGQTGGPVPCEEQLLSGSQ